MARAASRVVRHGTAKDLADACVGYSASGASEHSRHSAHSSKGREYDFRPERPQNLSPGQLIARTAKQIAKLSIDLRIESSRERRAKIKRDLDCKKALFERLKCEARK